MKELKDANTITSLLMIHATCLTSLVKMLLKFKKIQEDTDYPIAYRENRCHDGLDPVVKVLADKESRAAK